MRPEAVGDERDAGTLSWEAVDARGARMASTREGATTLTLRDRRSLFVPAPGASFQSAKDRATALDLMTSRSCTRVKLDGDVVVAVAAMRLSHAEDRAILAAFGMDVEAEISKRREDVEWTAPGWRSNGAAAGRMVATMDGRLTASVEIGARTWYRDLTFTHHGDLPAAAVAAMRRRQLRDVIDIPELRHLELRIRSAERDRNPALSDDSARVVIKVGDENGWQDIG